MRRETHDDDDIPRLPRGRHGFKLPMRELMTLLTLVVALVAVIGLGKGCASGVQNLFEAFEPPPDTGQSSRPALPK
ncbi:MAG: hypothetical protein HY698_05845 [Deltaproteobacteria bacterium]|nr:hypothetical protein [Deltaproteobacteria bacterium]